jgi:uncharacterized protein (UPF0332 family)
MSVTPDAAIFLAKAEESLSGAESEFANSRYNNCANRCYYACFQAALAALLAAGMAKGTQETGWGHALVQSQFVGQLINRRKVYPGELRDTLAQNLQLRQKADYKLSVVSEVQAGRALRRSRSFVTAIRPKGVKTYDNN